MADHYTFTDLHERLYGAEGEAVAELVRARLKELTETVRKRLAGGLASDEYERHRLLADALAAGERIMVMLPKPPTINVRGGG